MVSRTLSNCPRKSLNDDSIINYIKSFTVLDTTKNYILRLNESNTQKDFLNFIKDKKNNSFLLC